MGGGSMTCRSYAVHHAYPDESGIVPCCHAHWSDLIENGEVVTTDAGRVTCSGGRR